jgi:hypothetical protein
LRSDTKRIAFLAAVVLAATWACATADTRPIPDAASPAEIVFVPGAKDPAAELNELIRTLSLRSGGTVRLAGPVNIGSPIVLRSNVSLVGGAGTELRWTGDAKGPVLQTPADDTIAYCAFEGLRVFPGTAAVVFDFHSLYACHFRDLAVYGESDEAVIFRLFADSTGGAQPAGSRLRHIHASEFTNLASHGKCGTFMQVRGKKEGKDVYQVVTVNSFHHLYAWNCKHRGIDIQQWADSNAFSGVVRMNISGQGGVGLEINSAEPERDNGVYAITFTHLAIDTFGRNRARTAVRINASKHIDIYTLFNDPVAEAGTVVASPAAQSFDIHFMNVSTGKYDRISRGTPPR